MGSLKNAHIKPEYTKKAKKIFQKAYKSENLDVKFGRKLSDDENNIRSYILSQSPILGRIPSIEEIKRSFFRLIDKNVDLILNKLHNLDVIHMNNNRTMIEAAYPFSGLITSHLIKFKNESYKDIYAMCAVDALGICFMLDCNISINSRCVHCNEEVKIEIENKEIKYLKPESVVIWFDMEYRRCCSTSICKYTNFFSSLQHFTEWQKDTIKRKGYLLQVQEAFYLGKLFFEKRLKK